MSTVITASMVEPSINAEPVYFLQPWIVCFTAALFFFYIYIQLTMFNSLAPNLMASFHLSAVSFSHLSVEYFYADVLFLFPAGILLDRFSTRWLLSANMGIAVLMTILFAYSQVLWEAEVCRFIMGLIGAFCLLSCVRLASRWFSPRQMALVIGLVVTFAMLGGMVAQTPFAALTEHFGWRNALLVDAALGLCIFFLIISLVRDYPKGQALAVTTADTASSRKEFWRLIRHALANPQNWLGGIYASLLNLPILVLGAMWGSLYLMQGRGLSHQASTTVTAMLFVGVIIGSPLAGWISDRLARRKLPMIIGAMASIAVSLMIMLPQHLNFHELIFLFLLLGLVTSSQIIAYPLIAESNPVRVTGSAEGMASVIIMSGGFMQTLFASLLQSHWQHHYLHHLPVYSRIDFMWALGLVPMAMLLGLVAALLLRETNCLNQHSK
ncbi:MAG: MFS transporter [Gammaproteobacteria bacterium]|nr:MFS transporter [Gammaproteobacteria bacterium]